MCFNRSRRQCAHHYTCHSTLGVHVGITCNTYDAPPMSLYHTSTNSIHLKEFLRLYTEISHRRALAPGAQRSIKLTILDAPVEALVEARKECIDLFHGGHLAQLVQRALQLRRRDRAAPVNIPRTKEIEDPPVVCVECLAKPLAHCCRCGVRCGTTHVRLSGRLSGRRPQRVG